MMNEFVFGVTSHVVGLAIQTVQIYQIEGQDFESQLFLVAQTQQFHRMEEDRAEVDLGVAVDIEEKLEEAAAQRQPKKRFVGRRQAAEAASKNAANASVQESGAIQGKYPAMI